MFSIFTGLTRRRLVAFACLGWLLAVAPASAATRYWFANGTTAGGDGTWNTTTVNRWSTTTVGPATLAWVNGTDVAENSSGTANITLGTNLTLGGFTQKAGGSSSANSIEQGAGPYTLTLGINGANTFSTAANTTVGRSLIINAAIAGGPTNSLLLAGPGDTNTGTVYLGRANTFSGVTSFSAGATGGSRLILKHQLALQNSTVTLSADAAVTFDSSVAANAFTFGGLTASGVGTGFDLALQNNNASTPIALTVGGNNSSTTYEGVFSGGGSLVKTGSGTFILAGANTYTGSTTVGSGTLQVDDVIVSPTTVSNAATLAGGGTVNASVTVNAGGALTAGDESGGNLTVSNLTFSGTGALNFGTLSGYTTVAAVKVNNLLALNGGAGAVTLNLPTAPGFNGTYHLFQFGSGVVNTNRFTLGTVPALTFNQTGLLRTNGNYLDYVITATGDTTPPIVVSLLPANNSSTALPDTDLKATFNETILPGSGNIELRQSNGTLVQSFNVASSPYLAFSTAQLIIQPTNNLATGSYYVLIPVGAVKDTSSNNFVGITTTNGWKFTVPAPVVLYTDTGSPTNPPWSQILPTLNVASPDPGPVYGSLINVNNPAVETGLYGNRTISAGSLRIHVACNTSTTSFANFTRWFQTDGNTHVLRVFVDDENTATSRAGTSSHTEAFTTSGWNYTDGDTHEWTARYTIARLRQGYACFQLKNSDNDWAVQLSIGSSGSLTVNNRYGTDVTVTNLDGSVKNFTGAGFDVRVLDDGKNYKLWIDGVLYANSSFTRPTGTTVFRWGMYFGANNLNPPADYNLILISGAQTQSWPGLLNAAISSIVKTNNTSNLDTGASWVGGVVPGLYKQAVWDNTVTAANTTTLANNQTWAGLKILNPGGLVTINGTKILGLDSSGVDLTNATQNLTVNCPVQMPVASSWRVASGRTANFNGIISGYPGLTVSGGGTVQLSAANIYAGDTIINSGTVVANNNSALGAGLLVMNGGALSNSASCTLANEVALNSNATVGVGASQTLTLNGSLTETGSLTKSGAGTLTLSGANIFTGTTTVNGGTLALGHAGALLTTTSLTLAGGTLLQPNVDGVIITAPITVGTNGTTATISAPTNAPGGGVVSTLTLGSVISGAGNVTFSSSVNQNALSTIYLGGKSTYAGSTLLDTTNSTSTQIILKLGNNNALPTNSVLTIDGQLGTGTGRYAELNLNGYSQQLAGLTNVTRSLRVQRIVNSSVSAPATLTVNNSNNYAFSGTLGSSAASGSVSAAAMPGSINGDNFSVVKNGAGVLTLSGTNTYTGNTTVNGGRLEILLPYLATNSTVNIAAGAALQLNFAGTNVVAGFTTNGVNVAAGIYRSNNVAPFITGAGSLQIISVGPSGPVLLTNSVSGNTLSFSWPAGQGWKLQQQTNSSSTGLSTNWVNVTDGSANSTNILINQNQPAVFYRLFFP